VEEIEDYRKLGKTKNNRGPFTFDTVMF